MYPPLSEANRQRLMALCRLAVKNFNGGDWQALGVYTGELDKVTGHDRLLRSLSFGDDDYSGNAHRVMMEIAQANPRNLGIIEEYVREHYGTIGENISTAAGRARQIVFTPAVFEVPDDGVDPKLISVMTPFAPEFEPVFEAIRGACNDAGMKALRAKDIWLHSAVIQDVFSLIFRSAIVVCDFTGKNPNVFYEAGIAHTLGKHVVPITQADADIPFDLRHHRYLSYLNNGEGREQLRNGLNQRFWSLNQRTAFG